MTDLLAFSRDPVPVTLCGETFWLPWKPAAGWLLKVDHLDLLASLLATQEDRDRMAELTLFEPTGREQLRAESYRILGEQTGRKWWESVRLLGTSGSPEILGSLTLSSVDPWSVSVGQWCAAVYALCTRNQDQQGRLRFDFSLSIPPEGFEDEWDDGSDSPEETASAVAKLMG